MGDGAHLRTDEPLHGDTVEAVLLHETEMPGDDCRRSTVIEPCRFSVTERRKTRLGKVGIVVERDIRVDLEGMVVGSWPSRAVRRHRVVAPVVPELIPACDAEPSLITRNGLAEELRVGASSGMRTERLGLRVQRTMIDLHPGNIIAFVETYVAVVLRVA